MKKKLLRVDASALVEYGLIAALIVVAGITAVSAFGDRLHDGPRTSRSTTVR